MVKHFVLFNDTELKVYNLALFGERIFCYYHQGKYYNVCQWSPRCYLHYHMSCNGKTLTIEWMLKKDKGVLEFKPDIIATVMNSH